MTRPAAMWNISTGPAAAIGSTRPSVGKPPTRTEVIARAMHQAFERRTQQRQPFYSRQPWDAIGEKCQQEFMDYARAVDSALTREGH